MAGMAGLGLGAGLAKGLAKGIAMKQQMDEMELQKKLLNHQLGTLKTQQALEEKRMGLMDSVIQMIGGGLLGQVPAGGGQGPSVSPGWQGRMDREVQGVPQQMASGQMQGMIPSMAGLANWALTGKGDLFLDPETIYKDVGDRLIGVERHTGQPTGQMIPKSPETIYKDVGNQLVGVDSRTGQPTGQVIPKAVKPESQPYEIGGEQFQGWRDPYTGQWVQGSGPQQARPAPTGMTPPAMPGQAPAGQAAAQPSLSLRPGPGAVKLQGKKPLSSDAAARTAMAQEGQRHMNELQQIIFPQGPDGPVDRKALAMMGNWARLPAFPGSKGEVLRVKFQTALEPKIRIESGAAVPDSEIARLAERYMPKWWWDETLIRDQMTKLMQFFSGTIKAIDPQDLYKYDQDEVFWGRDNRGQKTYYRIVPKEPWVKIDAPEKPPTEMTDQELEALWQKRQGGKK